MTPTDWISVSERLPEHNRDVLVWIPEDEDAGNTGNGGGLVELTREDFKESGFTINTVRWSPMLQPNDATAGYLIVEFDQDDYSVFWEEVSTAEKFVSWFQFPAKRFLWGAGPQLDDFFAVWFRVWEWQARRNTR